MKGAYHKIRRNSEDDLEGCLEGRLVPARESTTSIDGLKLSGSDPSVPLEPEQSSMSVRMEEFLYGKRWRRWNSKEIRAEEGEERKLKKDAPVFAVDLVFGAVKASHFVVKLVVEGNRESEGFSDCEGGAREGDRGHLVSNVNVVCRGGDGGAIAFQFHVSKVNYELHAVEGDGVLRSLGKNHERGRNFSLVFTALHLRREVDLVAEGLHILRKEHALDDLLSATHDFVGVSLKARLVQAARAPSLILCRSWHVVFLDGAESPLRKSLCNVFIEFAYFL